MGPRIPTGDSTGVPEAHLLALPPPWETYSVPFVIKRIVQCPSPKSDGRRRAPAVHRADAIEITDTDAALPCFTWSQLVGLADHRVVIVSLSALAGAINRAAPHTAALHLRRQHDKPACAMVRDASFITRGFALDDVFWYGWYDPARNAYVQRYLARSPTLRCFCQRNGLITVLAGEADTDYGSGHPLCLFRAGRSGFLLAIDTEPPPSCRPAAPVSPYARRLIEQALGRTGPVRGQYVVTPRCRQEFEQMMTGLGDRFAPLRWLSTEGVEGNPPLGWIELDAEHAVRAADPQRRRIGIRTGFAPNEWDLVLGVATWLKQRVSYRRPPARTAASKGRLRHSHTAGYREPPIVQWTPLARRRAVPPPAGPKEFTYLVTVPRDLRRKRPERLPRPHVQIDLKRAPGSRIIVRAPSGTPNVRTLTRRLAELSSSFGVAIVTEKAPKASNTAEAWQLAFPVEPRADEYDAITAVDRVIEVLEAVVTATET